MKIEVVKMFKVPFDGVMQFKKLDAVSLTAVAIWLVEAIHNPDVPPLVFKEYPFIWRVNPEQGEPHISVEGLQFGFDLKYARELLDAIEALADEDQLLDDTYPSWYEHVAAANGGFLEYQVTMLTDTLLGYVSVSRNNVSLLPVALQLHLGSKAYYTIVKGQKKDGELFYSFN